MPGKLLITPPRYFGYCTRIAAEMTDGPEIRQAANGAAAELRTIKEGKATILVPQGAKVEEDRSEVQSVFYNPIQQYNRDLSVLAIKTYGEDVIQSKVEAVKKRHEKQQSKKRKRGDENGEQTESKPVAADTEAQAAGHTNAAQEPWRAPKVPFKMLDALSASGLRALRYGHELPFVTSIKANDLSASAAASIKQNVEHNGLQDIIEVTNDDALALMYRTIADGLSKRDRHGIPASSQKFDVIDLDPYGTAAPFFDAAVQSVRDDGGLLCITCTDSAVWAGHSYCEKTFALYGGTPIKGLHSHEAGLRLILNGIGVSAARYGLNIEPLLSLSIDFYTKVFVKVTKSPQAVKFHGAKSMLVYSCDSGCGAWETQPLMKSKPTPNKNGKGAFYKHVMALGPTADRLCQHCGVKMHINGPMYGGYIHSREFVEKLLAQIPEASTETYGTLPRLEGMLTTALDELLDAPEETQDVNPKEAKYATLDPYPFFIIPGKLSSVLSCATPGDDVFRGALKHLGYQAGRSHCRGGSIKTDAPWSTIWWIMTEWIRQKAPIKVSKYNSKMPAYKILKGAGLLPDEATSATEASTAEPADSKMEGAEDTAGAATAESAPGQASDDSLATQSQGQVSPTEAEMRKTLVFDEELAKLGKQGATRKVLRYQVNPRANWGPLTKAKSN